MIHTIHSGLVNAEHCCICIPGRVCVERSLTCVRPLLLCFAFEYLGIFTFSQPAEPAGRIPHRFWSPPPTSLFPPRQLGGGSGCLRPCTPITPLLPSSVTLCLRFSSRFEDSRPARAAAHLLAAPTCFARSTLRYPLPLCAGQPAAYRLHFPLCCLMTLTMAHAVGSAAAGQSFSTDNTAAAPPKHAKPRAKVQNHEQCNRHHSTNHPPNRWWAWGWGW